MTERTVTTTIEILGKLYPVKCPESELKSLEQAAAYLNQKMGDVKDSGKAINFERIAIITALNIAHQFLKIDQQKSTMVNKINQRIVQLQEKVDIAINKSLQTELIYTSK